MMALNTASDSPGDTIIPYYYVRVYFTRRSGTQQQRDADFIKHRAGHPVRQAARITKRRFP
jgi:hypothetical protein